MYFVKRTGQRQAAVNLAHSKAVLQQRNAAMDVLLEVNVSCEASKQWLAPARLAAVVPALLTLRNLRIRGLMTMAAYEVDAESCRATFARLRTLLDDLRPLVDPRH